MLVGMAIMMSTGFANASDTSATLTIAGEVSGYNPSTSCTVVPSMSSIAISGKNIIDQGAAPTDMASVVINVTNPDDLASCASEVAAGHIALKLRGASDSANGTSLANVDYNNPAFGVAIGLYNYDTKDIIAVNDGVLSVNKDTNSAKLGLQMVKLPGQNVTNGNVTGSLTIEIARL